MVVVVGSVLGVLITAIGGYLLAARRFGGKIATTEAAKLWDESTSMRTEYRDQLAAMGARATALEARVAQVEGRNNELTRENWDLRHQLAECQITIKEQGETIVQLEATIADLRDTVAAQEKELQQHG